MFCIREKLQYSCFYIENINYTILAQNLLLLFNKQEKNLQKSRNKLITHNFNEVLVRENNEMLQTGISDKGMPDFNNLFSKLKVSF